MLVTRPSLQVAIDCRILIEVPERFGFLLFIIFINLYIKKRLLFLTLYCLIQTDLAYKNKMGSKSTLKKFCKKIYGNRLRED